MRITHIINTVDPAYGGPAVVAPRLAAAQTAAGHDVEVLTSLSQKEIDALGSIFIDIPSHSQVVYKQIPTPRSPAGYPWSKNTQRQTKALLQGCDFLHLHGIWSPELLLAGTVAREMKIPYAIRPAGMLDPWSLKQKSLKKKLGLLIGRKTMINGAAFLHALNPDESELIQTGPLNLTCPVHVIPNGIFLDEIPIPTTTNHTFRDQHRNFLKNSPFVLFLSRLHHKKGLIHLADAFGAVAQRNPDLKLVVAGPDEGDQANFENRINTLGIQDRVLLPGPIYGSMKYEALRESYCFCLPSYQEGFSLALLEALGCGTPPIITPGCHFPEIESFGAGRIVEQDSDAIADAILGLAENHETRNAMSEASRRLVSTRYTWPKIAELTVQIYQNYITGDTA